MNSRNYVIASAAFLIAGTILCTQKADTAPTQQLKISNMSKKTVWVYKVSERRDETYIQQSQREKRVRTFNVPILHRLAPNKSISLSVPEGEKIRFIQMKKTQKYIISPAIITKALNSLIDKYTEQFGGIWVNSENSYITKFTDGKQETVAAKPYENPWSDAKLLSIEIPEFMQTTIKPAKGKKSITYYDNKIVKMS